MEPEFKITIMKSHNLSFRSIVVSLLSVLAFALPAQNLLKAPLELKNLKVEYVTTPIGVETQTTRFSWQMQSQDESRGDLQKAYQISVQDPSGRIVWNTGKVTGDGSLNIEYAGEALRPTTRYDWNVTVWDQKGRTSSSDSWFETGLMNSSINAWGGAKWIGGSTAQVPFYSPYLEVFKLAYTVQMDKATATKKAAFIFGANDSRLLDKNKNILNIESKRNETYIKLEFDFSKVIGSKDSLALLNIYRVGFHPGDNSNVPFKSFRLPASLISQANMYAPHQVSLECITGLLTLTIDGGKYVMPKDPSPSPFLQSAVNLNPMGWGGDYICYPMLAEIGFAVEAGKKAAFSDLKVMNSRKPSNTIFEENLSTGEYYKGAFAGFLQSGLSIKNNAYIVNGGKNGSLIIADPSRNSTPMLRTQFAVSDRKIAKARIYVTSRGIYEVYLNGKRVGEDYFNPGLTQYDRNHLYQVYDVTSRVQSGKNAIGVMLGEGWWSGNITFVSSMWNYFGDRQSVLMKLVVTYDDGSVQTIDSNPESWKYYSDGPIRCGSFFQGEVYDACKEAAVDGWTTAAYDDSKWSIATEVPATGTTNRDGVVFNYGPMKLMEMLPLQDYDKAALTANIGDNVRIVRELKAVNVEEVRPGVFVYDLGQNIVGFPKINIEGVSGQRITLRYAEMKYPGLPEYSTNKGMILIENLRAALSQDIYILKGGKEAIQPRFTSHGFRYIEITGIDKALPLEAVKGEAISSVYELASSYETSNADVNKLWNNISWSMRDNFVSIPTDCPQRNERMGWSGDISVFSRTATYMGNMPQFLRRHMMAMRDGQDSEGRFNDVAPIGGGFGGILWGSAGITVAWEAYQQYGDKAMLAEHYDAMKKYIGYLSKNIDSKTGITTAGFLGDWLSPEGSQMGPNSTNFLIWDAYNAYDVNLMRKMATALGKSEDAEMFAKMYDERKSHFNATYVDALTKKTIAPDTKKPIEMQAVYAVPLALDVFNEDTKAQVAAYLTENVKRKNMDDKGIVRPEFSLMTGFIGTSWISKALSDNGANDVAYRLLQQTSYPSWLYSVKQGATTIWERSNSYTVENGFGGNNSMNSFNHYSFGAVGAWMYNYSLGIQRDENSPAFKHFILQPMPDPDRVMTFAKGYYDSMYGRIESAWSISNGRLTFTATVPANTSATLYLPAKTVKSITESGNPVVRSTGLRFLKYEKGKAIFELASGTYRFDSDL